MVGAAVPTGTDWCLRQSEKIHVKSGEIYGNLGNGWNCTIENYHDFFPAEESLKCLEAILYEMEESVNVSLEVKNK